MLQYSINGNIADDAGNSSDKHHTTDKQEANVNEASNSPVADAIHTYRRKREFDESSRAKRERVTIIVLVATAIFALVAAIAAGVSAWFFYGQLTEMQKAGTDTRDLAKNAKDQAEVAHKTLVMSERPWLYVAGDIDNDFGSFIPVINSNFITISSKLSQRSKMSETQLPIISK
jgi:hypothetical protein